MLYIFFLGKVIYGGVKMILVYKMFGEINWEYIFVLYWISNLE